MTDERAFIHSIGTPIAAISLIVDSLAEDFAEPGADPGVVEQLEAIRKSVDALKKLVTERRDCLVNGNKL